MLVCPVCRLPFSDAQCRVHADQEVLFTPDAVPRALGSKFRVRGVHSIGDTGTAYVAEDVQTGQPGLLKILRVRKEAGREARDRLVSDLRAQAAVGAAPCLVPVRKYGMADGVPWLFRDWVDGESLKTRLARTGGLPLSEALVVTAQVALALHALHTKGAVHRAVRPGHILLRSEAGATPHAMLIDAGMAAHNDRDSAFEDLGDLYYMAPEQSRGEKVSFRTDLYALGCTLYHAVTGSPPFDGDDADAVVYAHLHQRPAIGRDALPGSIAGLLEKMLAKAPFDRPLSAQQILQELDPYLPEDWKSPAYVARGPVAPPFARTSPPPLGSKTRAALPPPLAAARTAASSAPPPRAAASDRPRAHQTPPMPLVQMRHAPLPARAADAFEIGSMPKPSSMPPADLDDFDASLPRRSRFPRATAGFLLGVAATLGAMWGLAYTGNFRLVTQTLTTHLAVPRAVLDRSLGVTAASALRAPEPRLTTPPPTETVADPASPVVGSVDAPAASPTMVQPPEAAPPIAAGSTEAAQAPTDATHAAARDGASATTTEERPMTRAERRRARRAELRERRRARARAARRVAGRRASSSGPDLNDPIGGLL